jgi:hypothetical protein
VAQVSVRQNPPGREQGLLSIAFHPDFKNNQLFYLFYSAASPKGQTTVDEFKRTGLTSSVKVRNVYAAAHSHQFHNGGSIAFSPTDSADKLYISIGDNQADGGPSAAQASEGSFGRIKRIDLANGKATTWDRGLRNPYRFSFDRATGDLYIADVGDGGSKAEKLFFSASGKSGSNWGWRGDDNRTGVTYLDQVATDGGAVIGGFVYRGTNPKLAGLCGRYIYGHLNGDVWSIQAKSNGTGTGKQTHGQLNTPDLGSFGQDANGEIYISSLSGGVYRIDAQ